jgi:hypothetical protein
VLAIAAAVSMFWLIVLWMRGTDFDLYRLTTALFWAAACLVSGMAVGFLFGIPRVDQGSTGKPVQVSESARVGDKTASVSGTAGVEYSQRVNTNLEEISDWLTKIIVGLGLVELRQIPGYLHSMATLLAHCLGAECSLTLASALIVWFAVLGFFIG